MIYELVIKDENIDEVFAVSLVEAPAIESNWVYFDKEEIQFAAIDNEKRMLMGPLLIPNKQILRMDGEGKPYWVFFSPETIKRLSEKYLENKYTDSATLEHADKIKGVHLVESWVKESETNDKSALYNLNVPVGTWLGTFKITNDEIWNDYVKTGIVKGFSIEGMFEHKLVEASSIDEILEKEITKLSDIEAQLVLNKIRNLFKQDKRYAKGKKMVKEDMEGVAPSVVSSYPGEGPNKRKKQTWSDVFSALK